MKTKLCLYSIFLLTVLSRLSRAVEIYQTPPLFAEKDIKNPNITFVHVIPHSHIDAGWLWTVENYYNGKNEWSACAHCVYDQVFQIIEGNDARKFTIAELAYFSRWWDSQTDAVRDKVRTKIKNGQIEFVEGAWTVNDEGCAYYEDIIDNFFTGHSWLLSTFNIVPTAAWSIDPFGHSSAQTDIFHELGFDSLFMERIDYHNFDARKNNRELEFIWDTLYDQGTKSGLYTHLNYYPYYIKPTSCPSILCSGNNPSTEDAGVKEYMSFITKMRGDHRNPHILQHIGGDFAWGYGRDWNLYNSLDNAMNYFNTLHPELNIRISYSTPSHFAQYAYQQVQKNATLFPKESGDFFPYTDGEDRYWVGYFTSRPPLKFLIREGGRRLQAWRKLLVRLGMDQVVKVGALKDITEKQLVSLEHAMGIMQHHDGVSGTAKDYVSEDYKRILSEAMSDLNWQIYNIINTKRKFSSLTVNNTFECLQNETAANCDVLVKLAKNSDESILLTVYNPGVYRETIVKAKMPQWKGAKVIDENNQKVPSDLVCYTETDCEIFFMDSLPSVSLKSYVVSSSSEDSDLAIGATSHIMSEKSTIPINNSLFAIYPNGTKYEFKLCHNKGCNTYRFSIEYFIYHSVKDDAYMFTPIKSALPYGGDLTNVTYYTGNSVTIIQVRREYITLTLRINNNSPWDLVMDTYMDPLELGPLPCVNVVARIKVDDFMNKGIFYTDANGLSMMKRIVGSNLNYDRKGSKSLVNITSNYYPITSAIRIRDKVTLDTLTVMTDRAQGGTSLNDGEIEIMINRRTNREGTVDEVFPNEHRNGRPTTVQLTHHLLFSNEDMRLPNNQRQVQGETDAPLVIMYNVLKGNVASFPKESEPKRLQCLRPNASSNIPEIYPNLKVFIRPFDTTTFQLRLHNQGDKGTISVPLIRGRQTDQGTKRGSRFLRDYLCLDNNFEIIEIVETSLTGNQELSALNARRKDWGSSTRDRKDKPQSGTSNSGSDLTVDVEPLSFRTFNIKIVIESASKDEMEDTDKVEEKPQNTGDTDKEKEKDKDEHVYDPETEILVGGRTRMKCTQSAFARWLSSDSLKVAMSYIMLLAVLFMSL